MREGYRLIFEFALFITGSAVLITVIWIVVESVKEQPKYNLAFVKSYHAVKSAEVNLLMANRHVAYGLHGSANDPHVGMALITEIELKSRRYDDQKYMDDFARIKERSETEHGKIVS